MDSTDSSSFLDEFFSPKGRLQRKYYLMYAIPLSIIPAFYINFTIAKGESGAIIFALFLLILAGVILTIQFIKRLHDINLSGWYVLLGLIPIVGNIFGLYVIFKDGTPGPNQYGEDPKGRNEVQLLPNQGDKKVIENHDQVSIKVKETSNNSFGIVPKSVVIIWALGMVFLMVYVPYSEYYANTDPTNVVELLGYDWIFSPPDTISNYANSVAFINYSYLILSITIWSMISWGTVFVLKD